MRTKIEKVPADLKRVITAAFPSWRGRKVYVSAVERVELQDTFWDGGSRSEYVAVALATLATAAPTREQCAPPQFGGFKTTPTAVLPEGAVIVEHAVFCGKDAGVTVYVNPANMPALLPAVSP